MPGVAEAVVIAEEKLAYLKVDSKTFDSAIAAHLAGAPYPLGRQLILFTGLPDTGFLSSPA